MNQSTLTVFRIQPAPYHGKNNESDQSIRETTKSFLSTISGMLRAEPDKTISFEIALKDNLISFLMVIPQDWVDTILQHLYTAYPYATIEKITPWRLLDHEGQLAGASLTISPEDAPLATDLPFDSDVVQSLLETFSHLPKNTRAGVQVVMQTSHRKKTFFSTLGTELNMGLKDFIHHLLRGTSELHETDADNVKAESVCFRTNINVMALAPHQEDARSYVQQLCSAFHKIGSNATKLKIIRLKQSEITFWLKQVLFRIWQKSRNIQLTLDEAASLLHLPAYPLAIPKLAALASTQLPPPSQPAEEGLFIGMSCYRGNYQKVYVSDEDRLRHTYLIGQTGTGKSTLFQSLILQDIIHGHGCCFIDPHGEAIDWLLPRIPGTRAKDVMLFDPSDDAAVLGLNLLEWHTPQERDLLIQELIYLFYKLFDPQQTGIIGPQFEHWLRNAALTITEPKVRGTVVDIPRLFTDEAFFQSILPRVEHPAVLDFWYNQMEQTADFHKSEMLNYFTSKFGSFLGNACMYRILSSRHSAFNMRTLMDQRKILLVNLSKGKLGQLNAQLLGIMIMTKLQMAALSRASQPQSERFPFYVYIDEFQNIATDSFASMLSEIRKYGIGLHLAHQYVDQLPVSVKQAIIGNVGTIMAFRLGQTDADWLTPHFAPLAHNDLTNIKPYHYHARPLMNGTLVSPFTIRSLPVEAPAQSDIENSIRQRVRNFVRTSERLQIEALS